MAPLVAGRASLDTSLGEFGLHVITATYTGSANFAGSQAYAAHTVQKFSTTTQLTSPVNPSVFGQAIVLNATVTSSQQTSLVLNGYVQFMDGPVSLGFAALSGGRASLTTNLGAGLHSLTAVYTGSENFLSSTSPALAQTVNKGEVTIQLSSQPTSPRVGENTTFSAILTVVAPVSGNINGSVDFYDGAVKLNSKTLPVNQNSVSFSTAGLSKGQHNISAVYSGGPNFQAVVSPILKVQVKP
jgi:hypothetical protein